MTRKWVLVVPVLFGVCMLARRGCTREDPAAARATDTRWPVVGATPRSPGRTSRQANRPAEATTPLAELVPPPLPGEGLGTTMARAYAAFTGQRIVACAFDPSPAGTLPMGYGYVAHEGGPEAPTDRPVGIGRYASFTTSIGWDRMIGNDVNLRVNEEATSAIVEIPGSGLVEVSFGTGAYGSLSTCTSVTVLAPAVVVHGVVVDTDGDPRADVSVALGLGAIHVPVDEDGRWSATLTAGPVVADIIAPEGSYSVNFLAADAEEVTLITDATVAASVDEAAGAAVAEDMVVRDAFAAEVASMLAGDDNRSSTP